MRQRKIPRDSGKVGAKGEAGTGAGYAKGQAKREEILVGLMNALSRGELRNPPLKAIGKALGVEPAHILYYFGSREDLIQAVIVRWDQDNVNRPGNADHDDIDLDQYVTMIARNVNKPGVIHLYLAFAAEAVEPSHPAHEFIRKRFERVIRSIAAAIAREQAAGTIPPGIDATIEARLLIALADGLQLQSLIDPDVDPAAHLAAAIAQLRKGSDGMPDD